MNKIFGAFASTIVISALCGCSSIPSNEIGSSYKEVGRYTQIINRITDMYGKDTETISSQYKDWYASERNENDFEIKSFTGYDDELKCDCTIEIYNDIYKTIEVNNNDVSDYNATYNNAINEISTMLGEAKTNEVNSDSYYAEWETDTTFVCYSVSFPVNSSASERIVIAVNG